VYVGRLSSRTDESELDYKFGKYGRIKTIDLKNGYAFVDFENEDDAEDSIYGLDGVDIDGSRVVVEMSRVGGSRGPRPPNPYRGVPPSHTDYRAVFTNLPRSMSWQDLKDLCHKYGPRPVFTDVIRGGSVIKGVAEFKNRDDLKRAVQELDGRKVDGETIACNEDSRDRSRSRSRSPSRSPPRKRRRKDSRSPRSRSRERSRSPSDREDGGKKRAGSPDGRSSDKASSP